MSRETTPPILYLIVLLVVINIAVTGWIVIKISPPSSAVSESPSVENLPSYLTKEAKLRIYSDFRQAFNSQNFDAFWDLFSDMAHVRTNKADMKKSYDQMLDYFGGVEGGTFSHYEYAEKQGNLKVFILYYAVKFSETSKFGRQGKLKLSVTDDGQEYGIISTYLLSETQ